MTISRPDYSLLQNSIATKGAINESDVAREADRKNASIQGYVNGTMNLIKGAAGLAVDYITTQDAAQQARLKPELEAKSTYYTQILNESIKKGTTTIGKDESGRTVVNYAPEVLEYRNSWMDDINSRDEISTRTKDWASKQMDAVYNMSDEQVLYTIAANNATLASTDMDKTVTDAAIASASQGSPEYLKQVISGLEISPQYQQAYLQEAMPIYESEYRTNHANELAATEGIDAAYKYINSLPIANSEKDTLKNGAYTSFQRSKQALLQSTDQSIETMLESGSSWSEIHKALEGNDEYTAYERSLVRDEITARQSTVVTNTCAPYLAQVQSGMLTVDELEDIKKDLKLNKGMFAGGLEGTYETYMGIVDNAIEKRKQADITDGTKSDSQTLTQFKLQAENYYDMWNQGKISGDEALSQIRAIAEANPDDLNVVNAMNDFVNKIISEKVPLQYRDYFNMKMDSFNTLYKNEASKLGYQPMNDDYVSNYETLYKDTVNFISSHEDLTAEDIDNFMNTEMDGFFARYADAKALADSQIPAAEPVPVEIPTKDLKGAAKTVYNEHDAGLRSTSQTLDYLQDLMVMASDDPDAQAEISGYIAKINSQKVPSKWEETYDSYVKSDGMFDNLWLRQTGASKLSDLDDDSYVRYISEKAFFETALADFISENPGINGTKLNAEVQRLMATFSAPYATQDLTLTEGKDSAGTKAQSFIDTLTSFQDTKPFIYSYNRATGKIEYEWVNDKAKENWDNTGRYGLQTLRALGYDVSDYEVFELGGEAMPVMVFRSSDGQSLYTMNLDAPSSPNDPQIGDVMKVSIKTVGNIQFAETAGTVSPAMSQQEGADRGARTPSGAPRNYVFDESSMGGIGTGGSPNLPEQAKARQDEAEHAEAEAKQADYEKREKIVNDRNQPHDETIDLYASALRERGVDVEEARKLAPQVAEEMDRLREQGVAQSDLWDTALRNLGITTEDNKPKRRQRAW